MSSKYTQWPQIKQQRKIQTDWFLFFCS